MADADDKELVAAAVAGEAAGGKRRHRARQPMPPETRTFFSGPSGLTSSVPAGIVTRSSIIIVDFIHLSLAGGRSLFEAIRELRGAAAPDPADGRGGDAVGFAHRDRPDLLGPGVGADIRPAGKQRATQ